jgi:DNA-binding CsgD family transcriptional regulator
MWDLRNSCSRLAKALFSFACFRNGKLWLTIFLLLTGPGKDILLSQVKTIGVPFIRNYTRRDYNAGTQNWAITQDNRGIMYFGNNYGILEYDGHTWQVYGMPNNSIVRSLVCDTNGTIYAGAFNEFGYLYPDNHGRLEYHSLSSRLRPEYRLFDEIWRIYRCENGILFHSFFAIFYVKDTTVKIIKFNDSFGYSMMWNNTLYINRSGRGIFAIDLHGKDSLITDGAFFSDKTLSFLLPWKNSILAGTNDRGMYILDNNRFRPWDCKVNEFLRENQIFTGIVLDPNLYAVGTVQNGLVIFDADGNLKQHVSKSKGLQNNTVLSLFQDEHNNLWLGLDNGIDYIKLNSPVTYVSPLKEIGAGYVSILHNGILYMGTNQGLYCVSWEKLISKDFDYPDFILIPNTPGQVWDLRILGGKLICGHNNGFYEITGTHARHFANLSGGWNCLPVPSHPGYVIGGTYRGLVLLYIDPSKGELSMIKPVAGFHESCREMEMDDQNNLWIGHGYKGIFRLRLNEKLDSVIWQTCYADEQGLPSKYNNGLFRINNEILVSSDEGIFMFDKQKQKFIPAEKYNAVFGTAKIDKVFQDPDGNIWFFQNNQLSVLRQSYDGNLTAESLPFTELKGNFVELYEHINFINNHNIIISTQDGFLHFDPVIGQPLKSELKVLIRKVATTQGEIIFGGNYRNEKGISSTARPYFQLEYLPYRSNDLHFEFVATSYENTGNAEYSYYLEGYDKKWSDWSPSEIKEYTNLKEGSYIFHVKARTLIDPAIEAGTFEFVINPPWYRSAFALIIYIALFLLAGYILIRMIRKHIEKEKEILKQNQKQELERKQREFENEKLQAEQEIMNLRNEKLQIEVERNKTELEGRTRELAAIAMQITYKNELLNQLKHKLMRVSQKIDHDEARKQMVEMVRKLEEEHAHEEDWHLFEQHFDQVYENFLKRIKEIHPGLTPKDLKICAYLRMNLSSKEIAPLLNISVRGVEISRYRLRKKLGLERDENLIEYLMKV